MKSNLKSVRNLVFYASASLCLSLLLGCEGDDDDRNHEPAPGKGSIIIDNNTPDDIAVFIDGIQKDDTDEYSDRAYDTEPGLHRVVLDQRGGDRNFHGDVDVLEGRLTILDVVVDSGDPFEYDVAIFFD